MKNLRFFLDFDGTVSASDVVDLALERYADETWRLAEKEWAAGAIGSRECLSRQVALLAAKAEELGAVADGVGVDPGFNGFLRAAAAYKIPVAVVSDGFDFFIRRILERAVPDRALLEALPVYCNHLEPAGGRWAAAFPAAACAHGCANCKPAAMRRVRAADDFVVFVGDGLSDRFAAADSDLVFAKGKLLEYCRQHGLKNHRPYTDFKEIEAWLNTWKAGRQAYQSLHPQV
ncbi:MAG TPA: MtnX-like HAD-IB family phosphatase [Candidatus Eisenbacteria bacterium]|nr:MtnX-like HAD-IB family phosphatase [Candidatus Eisenbacteria bacterium]